ncbi:hypothetical protein SLA2020_226930 [Shorea laevis]
MKIISWNCRVLAKSGFHKYVMDLKRLHNLFSLLILETKLFGKDAKNQAASLGFPKHCVVDSEGLVGGL